MKQITWGAVADRILKRFPKFLSPSPMCAFYVISGIVKMMDFTAVMSYFYGTIDFTKEDYPGSTDSVTGAL